MEEFKFKCVPVNERFYSDESTFGVYVVHTEDNIPETKSIPNSNFNMYSTNCKMTTLAGSMQQLNLGAEYEVTATLEYNKKYDTYQYKPKVIVSIAPKTVDQSKKFLSAILTERQTETLLEQYPNIVGDIIDGTDKVDIKNLKGIGEITYKKIKEKVLENYIISDILVLLQPLGVKFQTIKKLLNNEPNPVLLKKKLLDNPYIMLSIKGFGFKRVDALALKLSPHMRLSHFRVYAYLKFYLTEVGNNEGHTWVYFDNLKTAVANEIPECIEIFNEVISKERKLNENLFENYRKTTLFFSGNKVGLMRYFLQELQIFKHLVDLKNSDPITITDENIDNGIYMAEKGQGFALTEEQKQIVIGSTQSNVTIITGKAGCGKTTISRAILNIYKNAGCKIACCALSARAAQRITEATNFPAMTIHRLLGYNSEGFMYHEDNPLGEDVIMVDESSMINASIFNALLSAIKKGAKVIMCGDDRQLPPIGYGNIFGDLIIKDNVFHVAKLTKVLRQAEKSGILKDANMIREGNYPIERPAMKIVTGELQDMTYMFRATRPELTKIALGAFHQAVEQDGIDNVVIIVPRRDNCENSTTNLNNLIVNAVAKSKIVSFKDKKFFVGAKVMQMENNYEKNVFNGEVGYITTIDLQPKGKSQFMVNFKLGDNTKHITYGQNELDQLDLAYATTIHKSQGSGYDTVIIITDMTHYTLLDTCLLYTAITRAKKRCLVLSEPNAFKKCMANNKSVNRQTWLPMLKEGQVNQYTK